MSSHAWFKRSRKKSHTMARRERGEEEGGDQEAEGKELEQGWNPNLGF